MRIVRSGLHDNFGVGVELPRWLIGDQVTGDTGRWPLMAAAVKP